MPLVFSYSQSFDFRACVSLEVSHSKGTRRSSVMENDLVTHRAHPLNRFLCDQKRGISEHHDHHDQVSQDNTQ